MAPDSNSSRLGVCSWSLRAERTADLADRVRATGVEHVQLALDPIRGGAWTVAEVRDALGAVGATVRSGMMGTAGEDYTSLESIRRTGGLVPDEHWGANLEAARANAAIARELGLDLVSLHAGFLPHEADDPRRGALLDRLRQVADAFGSEGVELALETGQESAATLTAVLEEVDHPRIGVNFDPANMLLYGMGDPIDALRALMPWVRQVHIKDATPSAVPGEWGAEVPVGTGDVDWPAFFTVLAEASYTGDLMVEREAGEDRVGDIATAVRLVRSHWPAAGARS